MTVGGVELAGQRAPGVTLSDRFPDLSRHFIFEYYPWYGTNPYRHWNEAGRRPPIDLASNSCDAPPAFEPLSGFDWAAREDRHRASLASERRIAESFDKTVALQTDAALSNATRGFFLVYLSSFNEWHEGHQFEPMKDAVALTPEERARHYHNPEDGAHRLNALGKLLAQVLEPQ